MGRILLIVALALLLIIASVKRWKSLIVILGACMAGAVFFVSEIVQNLDTSGPHKIETVHVLYENDKKAFMNDPEVREILKSKYGLIVNRAQGRYPSKSLDGLWFSSQISSDAFKAEHPNIVPQAVLTSALVFYAWPEIIDALVTQGIVSSQDYGGQIIKNPKKLLGLIKNNTSWADLGLRHQEGRVKFQIPDPKISDSGKLAVLLTSFWLDDKKKLDFYEIYQKDEKFLPNSQTLFNKYVRQGQWAYPLILADENLLIAYYHAVPNYRERIKNKVRMLMPQPSIEIQHMFVPLTPKGKQVLTALKDPEIQTIAWENHGFRPAADTHIDVPQIFQAIGLNPQWPPDFIKIGVK